MDEFRIILDATCQIARNFAPGIVIGLVIIAWASFRHEQHVTLSEEDS